MTEGELLVSDLADCTVLLLAPLSTLRLQRLLRCTIAAGPVSGSAFLDGEDILTIMISVYLLLGFEEHMLLLSSLPLHTTRVSNRKEIVLCTCTDLDDCSVVLAAHQFRCHTSRDTTAWLRVNSNPIIEDCTHMVFGGMTQHHASVLLQLDAADTSSEPESHMDSSGISQSSPAAPPSSCAAEGTSAATDTSAWAAVQDFNHVHSATSPNW